MWVLFSLLSSLHVSLTLHNVCHSCNKFFIKVTFRLTVSLLIALSSHTSLTFIPLLLSSVSHLQHLCNASHSLRSHSLYSSYVLLIVYFLTTITLWEELKSNKDFNDFKVLMISVLSKYALHYMFSIRVNETS